MKKYVVAGSIIFATFGSAFAQQSQHPVLAKIEEGILHINAGRANVCKGAIEKSCLEETGRILADTQALKRRVEEFLRKPFDAKERAEIAAELTRLRDELYALDRKFADRNFRVGAN